MLAMMLALVDTPEEKALFREIYESHRGWMWKAAYGILKDHAAAEDAVSEAFFRVARKFSDLDINGADTPETRGLLLVIVKNEARRIYQKEASRKRREVPLEAAGRVEEESILTDIWARMVLEEIEKMGPTYRDVLYLALVESLRIRDVAYELGISVSAAQKRLQRGREILKTSIAVWGEGEMDE